MVRAGEPVGRRGALLAEWLALFGTDLAGIPEELCRTLVQTFWAPGFSWLTQPDMETLITWLQRLSPEDRRQVLGANPEDFAQLATTLQDHCLLWLLRLENADPGQVSAVESLLETWAQSKPDDGLLRVLDQALTWLRPETAEPLVRRILAALAASRLKDEHILQCLTADPPKSFRLQQALLENVVLRLEKDRREVLLRGLLVRLPAAEKTARADYLRTWAESRLAADAPPAEQ